MTHVWQIVVSVNPVDEELTQNEVLKGRSWVQNNNRLREAVRVRG